MEEPEKKEKKQHTIFDDPYGPLTITQGRILVAVVILVLGGLILLT